MIEREMLEAAARAAGYRFAWVGPDRDTPETLEKGTWNPRAFDGDALRLAAALRISVEHNSNTCRQPWVRARIDVSAWEAKVYQEDVPDESQRADRMRLAILRCAAAQAPAPTVGQKVVENAQERSETRMDAGSGCGPEAAPKEQA